MAEERLRELVNQIAKEHKYVDYDVTIKATSSGGANYTSTLYLATISAPRRDSIELFAKVSVLGEEIRKKMPEGLGRIYDIEYYFYSELYKIYESLEERHGVPQEHRLSVCKYYKCNPKYLEEALVLENLVAKGYKSFNRMLSITWEYAAAAVGQLAKLHALSFAYQQEYPEEFEKTLEKMPFPMDGGEEMMVIFKNNTIPSALSVIREENKDRLSKYLDSIGSQDWAAFFSANNCKVIIHCDYRASNLMHRRRNGKLEVTPVDFQTLYGGNPITDLMYFIYTGSDAKFRKQHYANLIEFYYTQLTAALRRLNMEPSKVYSKDNFNEDLKALNMFGIMLGVSTLSIVTVEAENAPKMHNDAQLEDFLVKPNELYTSRLNGIVDDYVRWGLL